MADTFRLHDFTTTTLDNAHETFRRWLGDSYDMEALDVVMCTLASHELGGDPLWLLVISGSGNAKTEVVQATGGGGAIVISTIASEAALLSGTPKKQQDKAATGGLLREIGERGVLAVKDVTSILSMHRDTRTTVLSALREVYDGYWTRRLGVDGGKVLEWRGRLTVIGAVTTAWDQAHAVIASMGDRFVLIRTDSCSGRVPAGRQAIANTGHETIMRQELAEAVSSVLAGITINIDLVLTDDEVDRLLAAADLVTKARTAVEYDYQGNVIDAHAPEMPTRFAKQLAQIMRGGLALGMDRHRALRLAIRCARDSMPPMRLAIVQDVATHPSTYTQDVRRRINKPRNTVDRQLQALHMLGVLTCDEVETGTSIRWAYRLADGIDPSALTVPEMSEQVHRAKRENGSSDGPLSSTYDIPGQANEPPSEVDPLLAARQAAFDGDEPW